MKIKQLLTEDDAVSPVIGVILMVAITVILAAVIATFVLGLGEQVSGTAPTASFTTEYSEIHDGTSGEATFRHDGGDTIKSGEIYIRGNNGSNPVNNEVPNFNDPWGDFVDNNVFTNADSEGSSSGEIEGESAVAAGDYIEFPVGSDAELRVVYDAQQGDQTATLATFEGPDA